MGLDLSVGTLFIGKHLCCARTESPDRNKIYNLCILYNEEDFFVIIIVIMLFIIKYG